MSSGRPWSSTHLGELSRCSEREAGSVAYLIGASSCTRALSGRHLRVVAALHRIGKQQQSALRRFTGALHSASPHRRTGQRRQADELCSSYSTSCQALGACCWLCLQGPPCPAGGASHGSVYDSTCVARAKQGRRPSPTACCSERIRARLLQRPAHRSTRSVQGAVQPSAEPPARQ
jgi:hypothetical protein